MRSGNPVPAHLHWRARLARIRQPRVVRQALVVALLVGSLLVVLNQGDLLFAGQITRRGLLKVLLTPLIPFCVTLLGAFLSSGNVVAAQAPWQARLALVCNPRVVRQALVAALVVGGLLVLLNQGDLLFSGQITRRVLLKVLLTPLIPFCVTLLGAFLSSGTPTRAG